ncbi:MAG: hypothetical protein CVV64_14415 [Candidatus Wallbacteria bacterium HGW-Wallbacteria-1]|jgi:PAS domain S-box-containing protein|uniref:histidine kinase n=1 Tax=Candidatus Wallbacteria bacterium HGW-Wallbacteria-1 TaxID=2013854 RepID=A0A2N1PM21_9BACT|nr:MAG: hypothetical protein CVV64_14415 [Candidatus Wallbacteria bacterium HGW-Wallbacteria-1]
MINNENIDNSFSFIQLIPCPVMILDHEQNYLAGNPALHKFLGISSKEILANEWFHYILPSDRERVSEKISRIAKVNEDKTFELHLVLSDGTIRNLIVQTDFITLEGRVSPCTILAFTDITNCKNINSDRGLKKQLTQTHKLETLGRIAGGIAHDLKNLLQPIVGYAYMLRRSATDLHPHTEAYDGILKSAEKARELLSKMLIFSSGLERDRKVETLSSIINGIVPLINRMLPEDIILNIDIIDSELKILSHRSQIEQILVNLCLNAKDAMIERGGEINISVSPATLFKNTIWGDTFMDSGQYCLVQVRDHGHGMNEDTLARVFEPFFSTKGTNGTGLGLSTVYEIVKKHSGAIKVESCPDSGTTFSLLFKRFQITNEFNENIFNEAKTNETIINETIINENDLPIKPNQTDDSIDSALEKEVSLENCSVVLVEDDYMVRRIIFKFLKTVGCRLMDFEDPADAVEKIKNSAMHIDLLISDVVMPKMKGPEVFTRLKQLNPKLKVIYITGHSKAYLKNEEVEEAVALLSKPFNPDELLKIVRKSLSDIMDNN